MEHDELQVSHTLCLYFAFCLLVNQQDDTEHNPMCVFVVRKAESESHCLRSGQGAGRGPFYFSASRLHMLSYPSLVWGL